MDNIIKIDAEDIEYSGIDKEGKRFTGVKRGANKTVAAKHIQHQTVFQVNPDVKKPNPSHTAFSFLTDAIDEKVTEIPVDSVENFFDSKAVVKKAEVEKPLPPPAVANPVKPGPLPGPLARPVG